jgi:hypothetical protein
VLKQIDSSIRQENATNKIIGALRRSQDPADADNAIGTFGRGNYEKSTDLHTANNLAMNLRRYAKPTDNGPRGSVASRVNAKLLWNEDGDTEDTVHFVRQAAQKNVRVSMLRGAREDAAAREAAAEAAAKKEGGR